MADPRTTLIAYPLTGGLDNQSDPEAVRPGMLTTQLNTRLSKVGGRTMKAPGSSLAYATAIESMWSGAVPLGTRDSTLAADVMPAQSRRIRGTTPAALTARTDASLPQSVTLATVTRSLAVSGFVGGYRVLSHCDYQGLTVVAWRSPPRELWSADDSYSVTVAAFAADGALAIAPTLVLSDTGKQTDFCAVTAHGSTLLLWYRTAPSNAVRVLALSVSGGTITAGAPTTVITPAALDDAECQVSLAYDPLDTESVFVVTPAAASANSVTISRVATSTRTVTASATTAMGAAVVSVSACYALDATDGNTPYLALAVGYGASSAVLYRLNVTTLASMWVSAISTSGARVQACMQRTSGGTIRGLLAQDERPTITVSTWNMSSGALDRVGILPWLTFAGPMRCVRNGIEWMAALTAQACYAIADSYDVTSASFIADPSVEVYRLLEVTDPFATTRLQAVPIARLGVDSARRLEAGAFASTANQSATADGEWSVLYLQDPENAGTSLATGIGRSARARLTTLSLSRQPGFAVGGAATVVAGAIPLSWDGDRVTELTLIRSPRITATTGAGPAVAAGSYLVAVVVSFVDAFGEVHRSPPSNVVEVTASGADAIFVTVADIHTYADGYTSPGYVATLYVSETNGTVLYASAEKPHLISVGLSGWDYVTPGSPGVMTPAIYTTGDAAMALSAWCPGAQKSAAYVGGRLWLLDAERVGRAWYAKPAESGVSAEMAAECYVDFPAAAGDLDSVSSVGDVPLFLGASGVWTVDGEGPDARLNPPLFARPRRISETPSTQRLGVVKTPVGVLYVSGSSFALLADGGATRMWPEVDASAHGDIVGTAVFRDDQEAVLFAEDGYAFVYNWAADAWSLWDTSITGLADVRGAAQAATGKVVLCGDTVARVLDPGTVSTTALVQVETPWLVFDGPQGDNNLQNVIVRCKSGGVHGVTVELATDYGAYQPAKTLSAADVTALLSSGAYDVDCEPRDRRARAARVRITETGAAGEGLQAMSATFEVTKAGNGKMVQAIKAGGRK